MKVYAKYRLFIDDWMKIVDVNDLTNAACYEFLNKQKPLLLNVAFHSPVKIRLYV